MGDVRNYMHEMWSGAGHLRFFIQPLLAIVIGVIQGVHDSHAGQGPFLMEARSRAGAERRRYWLEGLRRIVVPLCLAVGLSLIFQYFNRHDVHLVTALLAAVLLVALPYLIARGLGCRVDLRWHKTHPRKLQ